MSNDIMSKIAKLSNRVELSAEKIELGLVQDIEKQVAKLNGAISNIKKEEAKIGGITKKALEDISKIENKASADLEKSRDVLDNNLDSIDQAVAIANKAEAAAKDLGVDVKDIKGIAELIKTAEDLNKAYDSAKSDFVNAPF